MRLDSYSDTRMRSYSNDGRVDNSDVRSDDWSNPRTSAAVSERFTSPFVPLSVSSEAAESLEALAQDIVAGSIAGYQRFLMESGGRVDKSQWKLLFEQNGVRSYSKRMVGTSPFAGMAAAAGAAAGRNDLRAPAVADTPESPPPVVLAVGAIEGDLNDTVYGLVSPTLDQMRVKTSYVRDGLVRGSVLATLVAPSPDDPFRSLTVKWMEKGQSAQARAVVKNRDFVYLEATGIEYLRNGERVGYQLIHSIQFPETPARATAVRGNMSICALYRQKNSRETDVYVKGFLSPADGLARSIITRSAARALLSVSRNVYCCQMKKIKWAFRQRHRAVSTSSGQMTPEAVADGPCVSCARRRSAVSNFFAAAISRMSPVKKRRQYRHQCQLCEQHVCSDCRRMHRLTFLLSDHRLVQHRTVICSSCEEKAISVSAVDIARDELNLNGRSSLFEWSDTYTTPSSSPATMINDLN